MSNESLAISVTEAAKLLGISRRHAYHLCHDGGLPTIMLGARIVVPRAALNQLLAGSTTKEGARGDRDGG